MSPDAKPAAARVRPKPRTAAFRQWLVAASCGLLGCGANPVRSERPLSTAAPPSSTSTDAPTLAEASSIVVSPPRVPPSVEPTPHAKDPALLRAETLIASLPHRRLTQREVCAAVDAPGFRLPEVVVAWGDGDSMVVPPEDSWSPSTLVPRCNGPNPYGGSEHLTPLVVCDDVLPRCSFYLVSGGEKGTPLPPSERTYWFDWREGKLVMKVVALPRFQ